MVAVVSRVPESNHAKSQQFQGNFRKQNAVSRGLPSFFLDRVDGTIESNAKDVGE